jgi:hypothetical protein
MINRVCHDFSPSCFRVFLPAVSRGNENSVGYLFFREPSQNAIMKSLTSLHEDQVPTVLSAVELASEAPFAVVTLCSVMAGRLQIGSGQLIKCYSSFIDLDLSVL